ncbi:MAG TPA: glycosyltransferase [Ktedonobacterales bacterium]
MTIHMHSGLNATAQEAEAARASEGRWPRICERARTPVMASGEFEFAHRLRVAMMSLHTSPLAPLGRTRDAGGMNVYIRELARELGRSGVEIDIFTRRIDCDTPTIQYPAHGVRLISLPAGPATLLPPSELHPYVAEFSCRLARFAERELHSYDLIHSHYWLSAAAALPLTRAWNVPHVTMFHTVERLKSQQYGAPASDSHASQMRIKTERRIATTVERISVSTEQEGEQLRRLYGLAPSLFQVIPCGVDLDAFTPGTPAEHEMARQRLASDGRPMLLFVGRLDAIKDLDLLLASVARMRTDAVLHIVGGDPDGDPELDRLRALACDLGIAERVRFPGAVAQRGLPDYYRAADALVVTSRYESFGLAAVEALASGLPVVAAQVGGLPSIIRHGQNGLLVRWRCPEAFAEQLDLLLEDATLRERLSATARPSVERFSWERIGDEVRALYQELTPDARRALACSCH